LPDPKDDLVLEVAVNGECEAIVTFNARDFQGAERFGLAVLTPAELLAAIERQGESP
jgi:predicted nucleic acid-binding protein